MLKLLTISLLISIILSTSTGAIIIGNNSAIKGVVIPAQSSSSSSSGSFNTTYNSLLNQQCPVGYVVNGTLSNGTFTCVLATAGGNSSWNQTLANSLYLNINAVRGNVSGGGVANRVAFWLNGQNITSSGNLTFNDTNDQLAINRIKIYGTDPTGFGGTGGIRSEGTYFVGNFYSSIGSFFGVNNQFIGTRDSSKTGVLFSVATDIVDPFRIILWRAGASTGYVTHRVNAEGDTYIGEGCGQDLLETGYGILNVCGRNENKTVLKLYNWNNNQKGNYLDVVRMLTTTNSCSAFGDQESCDGQAGCSWDVDLEQCDGTYDTESETLWRTINSTGGEVNNLTYSFFGNNNEAFIKYNGTDFLFNPKASGTGRNYLQGNTITQGNMTITDRLLVGTSSSSTARFIIQDRGDGTRPMQIVTSSGTPISQVSNTGDFDLVSFNLYNSDLSTSANIRIVGRPDLKYIGMMSDNQIVWRSVATGGFFSAGAVDTGITRGNTATINITNGTTLQAVGNINFANSTFKQINGTRVIANYSSITGVAGFTGTCTIIGLTSITVEGGIITGCT